MVFHAFDVMMDDLLVKPEQGQKLGQELVAPGNIAGQGLARRSQDESAVLLVFEQPLGVEALDHVADAGLGNAKAGGDIDDPGVPLRVDQLQNSFEIIFDRGRVPPGFFGSRHGGGK